MSKLRYFITPRQHRRTIRCARRRIGAFGDPSQALTTALEVASVEQVRGHAVEVLHQDPDGRWATVTGATHHSPPPKWPVLPLD